MTPRRRDAEATKQRLIAAGRAEFAAHGLHGARVDRIAAAAKSNQAQIYYYFTSKVGLFDAVWEDHVRRITDKLPRDLDLPEMAVALSDLYADHPEMPRLITWQRLERAGHSPNELTSRDVRERIAFIGREQEEGKAASRFDSDVLFALVLHIAAFWEFTSPDVIAAVGMTDRMARREVVRAVAIALLGH